MMRKEKLYVVSERALPEVLLQVVEAKKLLEAKKVTTVGEAAEAVGISRSSFYKYKDEINFFYEDAKGKTISFLLEMEDRQGLLSEVLKEVAIHGVNILTIHQSIPVNGLASLSMSLQVSDGFTDVTEMVASIEAIDGIRRMKLLARE
ncbi:MAG: ACT domain-containing protein [Catonella sp.]